MPIYIYRDEEGNTFEIHQNMSDEPLTVSPETGLSCKRVITGGRPPLLDRDNVGIAEQMERKRRKALAENPLHTSLETYSSTISQRTKPL
jgi:hypothetical protein